MHYYIDGYNMLFRLWHGRDDLQNKRQSIIYDLNKKSSIVHWDISLVFDSIHQEGGSTRTHFDNVEILFTAEGETADEFILNELENSLSCKKETVVTSDRKLAQLARHFSARTEAVEAFMQRLNRSYQNKCIKTKPTLPAASTRPIPPVKSENNPPLSLPLPSPSSSLDRCQDYYEQIFEAEWQEILKNEQALKAEKQSHSQRLRRRPRQPPPDPFQSPLPPEISASNEMERWLILFENRLMNIDFPLL